MIIGNFWILGPQGNNVTIVSPTIKGDAELEAGNNISLVFSDAAWTNLDGATAELRITSLQTGRVWSFAASPPAIANFVWSVAVPLSSAQTDDLERGEMNQLDLIATLSGGATATLVTGVLTVRD